MTRVDRAFRYWAAAAGVIIMTVATACGQQAPENQPEKLSSVVSRVIKASPDRESTNYTPPSPAVAQAIASGVAELMNTGQADLSSYDQVPVELPKSGQERDGRPEPAVALVERGRPTAGNGLYIVRRAPTSQLVVQIPHPVADRYSEYMGSQLFAQSDARLFMMAGAHRNAGDDSADVAHRSDSTFAAVNDAVVQKGMTVVQIHGFSSDNHDDFGDVVLSNSVAEPSPTLRRLASDLEDEGFDTCTYDGKKCKALAATTNVQAVAARARGAEFIHIEVNQKVRKDRSERRQLMRTIAASLRASGVG